MTVKRQLLSFGSRSVDIRSGSGALDELHKFVKGSVGVPRRAFVVRDASTSGEVALALDRALSDAGFTATVREVAPCGGTPSLSAVEPLLDGFAAAGLTADDLVLAAGEAPTLAIASLAAKLWCGGTQSVLVPTTLDGMVRAATEARPFETSSSRDMVRFMPEPHMVVIDPTLLHGHDPEELREGYVYMIGAFMADSRRAWDRLGTLIPGIVLGEDAALLDALQTTQTARRLVLSAANPSARHALEYGLATAHALRACLGPEIPWWQLLAEGMRFEARLGVDVSSFDVDDVFEQDDRFDELGVEELAFDLDPARFIAAIRSEQARRSNRLLFAVPKVLGTIRLTAVPDDVLERHASAYLASRAELCTP